MDSERWNKLKERRKIEKKFIRVIRYWNSKELGTARRDGYGWYITEKEWRDENEHR